MSLSKKALSRHRRRVMFVAAGLFCAMMAVFALASCGQPTGTNTGPGSGNGDHGGGDDSGGNTGVQLIEVSANGSETEPTTKITVTFDKDIPGLAASDFSIREDLANTNIEIGEGLTKTGTGVYELSVSVPGDSGWIMLDVTKPPYSIIPNVGSVYVYGETVNGRKIASFESVTANGSKKVLTTLLTLTFNRDIEGLSPEDISFSGYQSNNYDMSASSVIRTDTGVYEVAINGIDASGEITVSLYNLENYQLEPYSMPVNVYYYRETGVDIGIGSSYIDLYLDNSNEPLEEGGTTRLALGEGIYTVRMKIYPYRKWWYLNGTPVGGVDDNMALVLSKRNAGTFQITVLTLDDFNTNVVNTANHTFVVE